ncbi:MAG: monovalent cation/H+ antiporter complex subunit F [Nakamurella sp.]
MTIMTVTTIVAGALFAIGAVAATVRLRRGPGALDRAAALDVLLAIAVGVIMLAAALSRSSVTLVVGVVVALLGFLGTASLARLLPREATQGPTPPPDATATAPTADDPATDVEREGR